MKRFVAAELRARRRMVASLAAGAFTYLLIIALVYHSIGVEALGQAFHGEMPRSITAFSGSRSGNILSPQGWMGLGFNHPMLMITSLTAALAIGTGAIAGEVDSGRADLLLSGPVDRTRFLAATLLVWAIAEAAILIIGLSGALLGGALSADLRHAGLAGLAWAQLLPLTLFVASVSFVASAKSDSARPRAGNRRRGHRLRLPAQRGQRTECLARLVALVHAVRLLRPRRGNRTRPTPRLDRGPRRRIRPPSVHREDGLGTARPCVTSLYWLTLRSHSRRRSTYSRGRVRSSLSATSSQRNACDSSPS